ncbi:hypothetical protein BpHYR1_040779 [Brachionus plicatilis]|uniref:Uncharacterized protein n=1 Tax=Brachionus plicatilis TaxID=10195 RepID=A0A3M7Q2P0_BRAPC|nr:hypothetical protein BpHYR1_040779 [Brachionus plicatilis]
MTGVTAYLIGEEIRVLYIMLQGLTAQLIFYDLRQTSSVLIEKNSASYKIMIHQFNKQPQNNICVNIVSRLIILDLVHANCVILSKFLSIKKNRLIQQFKAYA